MTSADRSPGTGAAQLHRFLGELRHADDDVLAQAISREVCVCLGFAKSMFSWVDGPDWLPAHVHVPERLRGFDDLRSAVDGSPIPLLRAPLEAGLVLRQQPYTLQRNEFHRDSYRPLVDLSNPAAYAAAPIVANGHTVGILHVDRHTSRIDDDDVHLLLMAARLAGVVVTAAHNRRRLRDRQAEVTRLVEDVLRVEDRNTRPQSLFGDASSAATTVTDRRPGASPPIASLSARERDILALVVTGATNRQIARELYITEGTVKTHVRRIFAKLGVHSRAQAAARFQRFDARYRS
ncbi:GAF domain-containing protein [Gordonia sp. TBRC 11910]|uniref:GAF domain-containing protein n=1 Tax=Gordonia asplenii TaxID=2725283 RepID=A0A848L5M8_9ACTN|nr:LuxR C-terminal-related transcriptional regulator [Gordonia asplenii]NMO03953.1 GAF domain-containing protein [Gordonia asplenii]